MRQAAFAAGILFMVVALIVAPVARAQVIPAFSGPVVDAAGMLTPDQERRIVDLLTRHRDTHGHEVVVATIPSLFGQPIENVSLRIARTWDLGQGAKSEAVLILVAENDRELRIEVASGLRKKLTDDRAAQIIENDMAPLLREGFVADGIENGVTSVLAAISAEAPVRSVSQPMSSTRKTLNVVSILAMLALTMLFFMVARAGSAEGVTAGYNRDRKQSRSRFDNDRWRKKWESKATPRSRSSSGGGFKSGSRGGLSRRGSRGGFSSGGSRGGGGFRGGGASGGW